MARLSGADVRVADQDAVAIDIGALLIEAHEYHDRTGGRGLGLPHEFALRQVLGPGLRRYLLSFEARDGEAPDHKTKNKGKKG
jgi:hypothetical protein